MSLTTSQNATILRPSNFTELCRFAEMFSKSSMVPKDYQGKPENIVIAVQMGSELGLAPMQSLQNIAVIGNRPAVWGDAMLALIQAHPECEDVIEEMEGEGDSLTAVCTVKRRGRSPVRRSFSVADAKQAGLLGKAGPWTQYRNRMLAMRARGFACRDAFPDALRGLISAEEARDIPPDDFKGTTINAEPARPAPKARDAEIVEDKDPLYTRTSAAIARIQDTRPTEENCALLEKKLAPLLADLDEAGRTGDKEAVTLALADLRAAIRPVESAA